MLLTPPLHTKGRYVVKEPFVTDPSVLYTCAAIRTFRDIRERGFDPFVEFYQPMGLTQTQFNEDEELGASVITLVSDSDPTLYIPTSFILSYPNQHFVPYNHVVLSVSLGLVPDYVDYTFLQDQISGVVSDVIGVESDVKLHIAPTREALSPEEHEVLEVSRLSAVQMRVTDHARVLELERKNQKLLDQLATLETIIKQNNLV